MRKCARCEEVSWLGRDYCGYPVLYFHFAYNSCVEFRTRGLCKRSGWWDVMRAARLACRGTCGDYELNLRFLYFWTFSAKFDLQFDLQLKYLVFS